MNSVLAFEDKKSYLCHLWGRCTCKKPSEHVSVYSTLTGYSYHDSHHKFDNKDYNTTALNAIAKYKQITKTEDIAKTFIRTDQLLYDLYLFDCTFTFCGYNIMGTNYQYASRSLINGRGVARRVGAFDFCKRVLIYFNRLPNKEYPYLRPANRKPILDAERNILIKCIHPYTQLHDIFNQIYLWCYYSDKMIILMTKVI